MRQEVHPMDFLQESMLDETEKLMQKMDIFIIILFCKILNLEIFIIIHLGLIVMIISVLLSFLCYVRSKLLAANCLFWNIKFLLVRRRIFQINI